MIMRLRRIVRRIPRWRFPVWLLVLWNLGFPVLVVAAIVTAPPSSDSDEQRTTNNAAPIYGFGLWIVVSVILLCYYAHATNENRRNGSPWGGDG
jgi:hypothetical protein